MISTALELTAVTNRRAPRAIAGKERVVRAVFRWNALNKVNRVADRANNPSPQAPISDKPFSFLAHPIPAPKRPLWVKMLPTKHPNPSPPAPAERRIMDTQDPTNASNEPISELSERIARIETNMARMETKMDFMATHKDIAAVRVEIEGTRAEIASMKGELLNQMAQMNTAMVAEMARMNTAIAAEMAETNTAIEGTRTLIANREASMQRWLLGLTATMVVALSAALFRTLT